MNLAQLQSVVSTMTSMTYEDGHLIIRKGDEGTKFFVIKKGQAVVFAGEDEKESVPLGGSKITSGDISNEPLTILATSKV